MLYEVWKHPAHFIGTCEAATAAEAAQKLSGTHAYPVEIKPYVQQAEGSTPFYDSDNETGAESDVYGYL